MYRAEIPLVEFCTYLLPAARRAGYKVVLVAISRHADSPRFFRDVIRDWVSLHDATGPDILFVFAGENAADRLSYDGIPDVRDPQMVASEDAAVTGRRPLTLDLRIGPRRPPETIADDHTGEISSLRRMYGITESRLPCFAFFVLRNDLIFEPPRFIVPLVTAAPKGVYPYVKSLAESCEAEFHEIDRLRSATVPTRRRDLSGLRISVRSAAASLPNPDARRAVGQILALTRESGSRADCLQNLRIVVRDWNGPYARSGSSSDWKSLISNLQRLIDVGAQSRDLDAAWDNLDKRLRSMHDSPVHIPQTSLSYDRLATEPAPALPEPSPAGPPRRSDRTIWIWAGRIIAVAAAIDLAVYLYTVGLENADRMASVLGLFVALAALLSPLLIRRRRPPR